MDENVTRYRDAVAAYERARSAAGAMVSEISKVTSSASYSLGEFLAANYGFQARNISIHEAREHAYNMNGWPDASMVNTTFQALVDTFTEMRTAWTNIPESERGYLKTPPDRPEAK
ncbi:hypothetical protein [Azospirillum sp.]|uniref:hypothetical protein n=1 Tax=Azospirillum sp. TaxID=34012 RepID=UPI003D70AB98